ncbi:MAG: hypothetical protein HQ580_20020 [Planctomycetes bacterium]|nr:hypothetical protein [Planctomycetota bacterium]
MRKKTFPLRFLTTAGLIILCFLVVTVFGKKKKAEQLVFNLEEISIFDIDEQIVGRFVRGQVSVCEEQPQADVETYPAFKSDKPLYGSVWFAGEYGNKYSGIQYHFAIDESEGTGKGYDRLFFDLNRDLDLTNDTLCQSLQNPPDGVELDYEWIEQQVCFDYLNVSFDFGSDGRRPLENMPRLTISEKGYSTLAFVTTQAHKSEIDLAGKKYTAYLGHNYQIPGWFNHPSTALHLIPKEDKSSRPSWLGAKQLRSIHKFEGTYYRFSSTPSGDKLIAQPYDGDFGTFKLGSGWRLIFNKQMNGSLLSKDAALAVGKDFTRSFPKEAPRSCRLPVGDYLPAMLHITFGPLRIDISDNYHSDGKPRDRSGNPPVYGIKIRKNKPFVLNFSNKPDVIFASPAADLRLKPGDNLDVKAVLVDPELDIMIRGLKTKPSYADSLLLIKLSTIILILPGILCLLLPRLRRRYRFLPLISALGAVVLIVCLIALPALGPKAGYDEIVPRVLITQTNGEKVAEGAMPFG